MKVTRFAQSWQAKVSLGIAHQVAFFDWINVGDDGGRPQPIHDFKFIILAGSGMSASLGNHQSWTQAAFHGFCQAEDMMASGLGVNAAKFQLPEFSAIFVPLEDKSLGPVMPDGRRGNEIKINDDDLHLASNDSGEAIKTQVILGQI